MRKYFLYLPNSFILVALCSLFLIIFASFLDPLRKELLSREITPKYNPSKDLELFTNALKEKNNQYRLLKGAFFEKMPEYIAHAPSNMLVDIRYISKTPASGASKALFLRESEMIKMYLDKKVSFKKSLFIQNAFQTPRTEQLYLKTRKAIFLRARLLSASLWVHSQNYPHHLILVFQNSRNKRVEVSAGKLNWHGWRRLHIKLPQVHFPMGRLVRSDSQHQFLGFKIKAGSYFKNGNFSIILDNFLILGDMKELNYPGAEIEDVWGR